MMAANCGCLHSVGIRQLTALPPVTSPCIAASASCVTELELPNVASISRTTQLQRLHSSCFKPGISGLKFETGMRHLWRRSQSNLRLTRCLTANQSLTTPNAPIATAPVKQETDIRVVEIAKGIVTLRGCHHDRPKYEIEYSMNHGTTDNSYLIKGEIGFALIDVPDEGFSEAFTKLLAEIVDVKVLKYLILGHFSPKRLKSLSTLLEILPDEAPLQIFCSNPAAQLLNKSILEGLEAKKLSVKIVRTGDILDLGGGHELRFFSTPTPRWPDGLCTYDPVSQLLFSQKLFSAHVIGASDYDIGGWDAYGEDWRFYYDCMLAPTPLQAKAALDKLQVVAQFSKPAYKGKIGIEIVKADMMYIFSTVMEALKLPKFKSPPVKSSEPGGALVTSAICPLHGPIVQSSVTELVREYGEWTSEKVKQLSDATVAVVYASAYGMTATLAQAISRGISKAGVGIDMINVEIDSTEDLVAALQRASGFVIGSPTLAGNLPTPVQNALGVILNNDNAKSKPCGVFGSFGWSGEAVDILETRLTDCGFVLAFPSIRCKFQPTEATIQICEESGTDLAQAVKRTKLKKRSQSSPKFTVASKLEQAVGRVVGSLCVLSAKSGDAESAMLASWVSQASFVPPGLTVAVAKDRAVEGLILPGGQFVLNVLGQLKSGPIVKQLLKPFKPGETRYDGLEITSAGCGGFILKEAIAWMECTVQSRLETGDHWVLYATVDSGSLQDEEALTAIHYRRTGARY